MLREAYASVPFRLVSLNGGKSRNAIPRDAIAVCSVPRDQESAFRAAVESATAVVRDAYAKTDPGATVTIEAAGDAGDAWTEEATATLLDVVALVPTGPLAMSPDFDKLVETSTSLGEAATEGERLTLHSLSRSSNDSAMPEVIATLDAAARLAGGTLEVKHNYNGWRPNLDSPAAGGRAHGLRAALRQAPGGHGDPCGSRDGRHRQQGQRQPRHAGDRSADRRSALARRAR